MTVTTKVFVSSCVDTWHMCTDDSEKVTASITFYVPANFGLSIRHQNQKSKSNMAVVNTPVFVFSKTLFNCSLLVGEYYEWLTSEEYTTGDSGSFKRSIQGLNCVTWVNSPIYIYI
jgi:hypothetical protein